MMFKTSYLVIASVAAALTPPTAWAQRLVIITPPAYFSGAGPQLGGPPYQRPGFTIYPPASTTLPPQLTNPAANPYPPGAQTCVATPYTCRAPAPNTPGNACACPTNDGGSVAGIVH